MINWIIKQDKIYQKNVEQKKLVDDSASELYNKQLGDYELQYKNFSDEKKKKNEEAFQTKFRDESLDRYSYDKWFDIPNDKELIY